MSISLTMSASPSPMPSACCWIPDITSRPVIPPSIIMVSNVSRAFMTFPERASPIIFWVAFVAGVSTSLNTVSRSTFFPDADEACSIPRATRMSPSDARAMPSGTPSESWTPSASAISETRLASTSRGIGLKVTVLHLDLTGSMIMDGWLQARMNAQFPEYTSMVRLRASWTSLERVSTSSMNATLNLTPSMDDVVANSLILHRGLESFLMTVLDDEFPSSSTSDFCSTGLDLVRSEASISRKFPAVMPPRTSRASISAHVVFPDPGGPERRRWGRLSPDVNDLSLSTA